MPLHPAAEALVATFHADPWSRAAEISIEEWRRVAAARGSSASRRRAPMSAVTDEVVAGRPPVPVRVYEPMPRPAGTLIWMHGGGFALGSLEETDPLARRVAAATGYRVISVGYRLAPEHPYPSGLDDCVAVVRWAAATQRDGRAGRLVVAGESAGGNLAAAACLRLRDGGPRIDAQILAYPMTSRRDDGFASRGEPLAHWPDPAAIEYLWSLYLGGNDPDDPFVSPLAAPDLSGLPPALVITAEYDTLRDEGERYAARLADAGVPTRMLRMPGMLHGFLDQEAVPGIAPFAEEALAAVATAVQGG